MNLRHVAITLAKELREALRDRRTLAIMILLPLVVYPLLSLLAAQVATGRDKQREQRPSTVALVGSGPDHALAASIRQNPTLFVLLPAGTAADIEGGSLEALIERDSRDATKLTLVYDASRDESRLAEERLGDLIAKGLPDGCAPTLTADRRSVAPQARVGGYLLSKALPLFVVLMVLLGAFYPAIDVTAGERERGTLETVLCSPIQRFDLMFGKVLAVATLAALTGVLNLASMAITLMQILRLATAQNVVPDVPWGHALAASLVIFPAALLFAAAFVALGATARTLKEAQTLLLPVYFLTVAPAMAGAIGEYRLAGIAAWIPGMNVTLLARDLMVGRAHWSGGLAALLSTLIFAAAALAVAARIYDSERFMVPAPRRQAQPGSATRTTTAGDALTLFGLAFLLLYFVFLPIEQHHLTAGLLAAEWIGLLGLVGLFARVSGQGFAKVVGLTRPTARALLGAALVGCGAWAAVAVLSEWLLPVPKEMLEQLRRSLVPLDGSRGFVGTLLLVAVSPAICEEALFRGPILRGLRTRLDAVAAAAITGLLFGLFHLDLYRLIPTAILGVLLSWIALECGSIVPSMLAHFCNNAILITLARSRLDQRMESLSHRAITLIVLASLALVGVGLMLVRGTRRKREM